MDFMDFIWLCVCVCVWTHSSLHPGFCWFTNLFNLFNLYRFVCWICFKCYYYDIFLYIYIYRWTIAHEEVVELFFSSKEGEEGEEAEDWVLVVLEWLCYLPALKQPAPQYRETRLPCFKWSAVMLLLALDSCRRKVPVPVPVSVLVLVLVLVSVSVH